MFRKKTQLPPMAEVKQNSYYALYLSPDNKPESIDKALLEVKDGNAVLLYPDPKDFKNIFTGRRQYKAYFIHQGKLAVNEKKELTEITMGSYVLNGTGILSPTDIPDHAELIKTALSKKPLKPLPKDRALDLFQKARDPLLPFMDDETLAAFSQISRFTHNLTRPERTKKLVYHVIRGEEAEAKKMLEANPHLLLEKGRVTDYSGRHIEGTAFQLALGAEDAEMLEMMMPYFNKLEEGQAKKQYQEQFPPQWEEKEAKERAANDLSALRKVFNAVKDAKFDDNSYEACERACEGALVEFRDYLQSQAKAVIKHGTHFNAQLLIEALKLYHDNFEPFGNKWESARNTLCRRKIIGYIQRFLPACYAQAFCQGLMHLVESREKLSRSLLMSSIVANNTYSFFPLPSAQSGLGFDKGGDFIHSIRGDTPYGIEYCKYYFNKKRARLAITYTAIHQPKRTCVILL